MPSRLAGLAGNGAFAAIVVFVAIYALVVDISLPRHGAGMLPTLDVVTWISVGLVVVALIIVHVVIGRQLLLLAKDSGPQPL